MTDRLDLPQRYRSVLEGLLREHVPDAEAWAYGSRITGESHEGSDLDLVVRGPGLEPLGDGFFSLLEAIEESNIPILVQAHDWARLPVSFHPEIERDYVVVQEDQSGTESWWTATTWGELATLEYGKSLRGYDSADGPYRVYGTNGPIGKHNEPLCPHASVIIGRKGANRGVHYSPDPFYVIDTAFYMKPKVDLDTRWAYYQLLTQDINGLDSGSAIPSTSREDFYGLPVDVPPLTEQHAIAHVLGTLDDKIELNRRMSETLEEMARALFKSWFVDFDPVHAKAALRQHAGSGSDAHHGTICAQGVTDGKGSPGWTVERAHAYLDKMDPSIAALFPDRFVDSDLGEIPEGWEVNALGELIELAYGKALKAADRKDGHIPVYGSNGQVGWHDERLMCGPGIIVGRKGNPGTVTWANGDFFPIDTTFYVVPIGARVSLPFLFFALNTQDLPSVSADSAVPGLSRNLAYMNRQVVPTRSIVNRFDGIANEIFSRVRELDRESRTVATQRDSLLPELVSGDLRVGTAPCFRQA